MITHFVAFFFVGNNTSNRKKGFNGHQKCLLKELFLEDFFEEHTFLGRAVLSKTVNCSGVNLVNAVLSDLANTSD